MGLGASAGGLAALEQFFASVPAAPGVAFVVITHQHPDHTTLLHALIGRKTAMLVSLVEDDTIIEADHVYVAPPGRVVSIESDRLRTVERDDRTTLHLPIDAFFRSLATDRKDQAVGIILSGTGTDGTIGIKEIKAVLGMAMAQDEASASYSGMPHSAIQTGLVDYVLAPAEMPDPLLAYVRGLDRAPGPATGVPVQALGGIFLLLRSRTGNDYSHNKMSTVRRRIERRMNVRHVATVPAYTELLREHPEEVDLLFHDLLIGVTSFFRDPAAFEALCAVLPDMVERGEQRGVLRVWVPGCSTGEEAYTIAMLLHECRDRLQRSLEIQIFATDLDAEAIETARMGVYPGGIAHHVTPERLARFFTREDDTFRIKKEVRETLVLAPQNILADPPFTKLDLLACRNLLIYLDGSLQQRLLPMFHYALRPGGVLMLGSSESLGAGTALFEAVDKKWKIFRRTAAEASGYVADLKAITSMRDAHAGTTAAATASRPMGPSVSTAERLLLHELVPPTVIVTEQGELVHVHGRTGRFLEPAPGSQRATNVLDMAREGLRLELSAALRLAATKGEVLRRDVRVTSEGGAVLVDVRVKPVRSSDRFGNLMLVTFEHARATPVGAEPPHDEATPSSSIDRVVELERELHQNKQIHQGTIEELETSNEELQSTNEELQSTNEELQSVNEELETSKEEMQSLNEELQTVNAELQGKIEELSQVNDDMKNLLNSTDIATVFLDDRLNIKRYTNQARRVIRLIPSDVGRPIGDLVARLHYDGLVDDAGEVLRTLVFKEAEVRAEDGGWYLMRILPYRTTENVIDGLVITFVDITKIKALQQGEARLDRLLQATPTAILGQDRELRYVWVSGAAFGRPRAASIVGKRDADLFPPKEAERLTALKRAVLEANAPRRELLPLTIDGAPRIFDVYLQPIDGDGAGSTVLSCVVTDTGSVPTPP